MLIFTLNQKNLKTLDIKTFWAILNLMLRYRQKLFDDEYFNVQTPLIQRVFEIISAHIPYFWLFKDEITGKTLGFCYFYDIVPYKSHIYSVSATICFDKKAWGKPALFSAKSLINKVFRELNIYKIKAECYFDNIFIPKFLAKLGFEHEATLKNETIVDSVPKNIEIWSIFNPNPLF